MKVVFLFLLGFISVSLFGQQKVTNKKVTNIDFCKISREASLIPIRPGIPGKRAFWNEKAKMFKYVPSFKNTRRIEISPTSFVYTAFSFTDKNYYSFTAGTGTELLTPIWDKLPNGNIYLKIEGRTPEGYVSLVEDRMFYKAATFCPPYPDAKYSYHNALKKGLQFLYNQKFVKNWYYSDKPDHDAMPLYCYSSKVVGSVIDGMLLYHKYFPKNDSSLIIARKAADYLISHAEPANTQLAYFPQTYEGTHLSAEVFGNEILMTEPAWTAITFLDLYEQTKMKKYYNAAINIADTYVNNQLSSGTWYIRIDKGTGKPTSKALCIPNNIINFLSVLIDIYKLTQYQPNVQSAFQWILNNPMKTFDWTGQFEDVGVANQYQNLTHFEPSWVAMRLLDSKDKNEEDSSIQKAKELINFCEDQFVVWEKPDLYDDRNSLSNQWHVPATLEQYNCFLPIDGSTDQMIFTFLKAFEKTGDPVYKAKAIALANSIVNCQKEDGKIPTFLYPFREDNFWPNCMVYSLKMLEKMSTLK